jgi:hypothetical protein
LGGEEALLKRRGIRSLTKKKRESFLKADQFFSVSESIFS